MNIAFVYALSKTAILLALGILLAVSSPNIYSSHLTSNPPGLTYITKTYPSWYSTEKVFTHYHSCRNGDTLKPINCLVDFGLEGVWPPSDAKNSGYHVGHPSFRPLTFTKDRKEVPLRSEHDLDPEELQVLTYTMDGSGRTKSKIVWPKPKAAGILLNEAFVQSPDGFHCIGACLDKRTHWHHYIYNSGYPGLKLLPDGGLAAGYVKGRDPNKPTNIYHANEYAFWGKESTNNAIFVIGQIYYDLSGRLLSVNDMSLPKGGIFDIYGNYEADHKSHYTGTDADINRDGIDCQYDTDFFHAVDCILPPVPGREINGKPTAIDCHINTPQEGFKHIDF
ncbi:MAG: hypothetical protein BMS9Abin36_0176 [Gammaproteobacteria bacterium]|nr:MAG: hypothetical protein BMS9Abin36_0176 [Gammaproteobacteria bacterium]